MSTNFRNPGLLAVTAGVGLAVIFAALAFSGVLDTRYGLGLAVVSLVAASFMYIFFSRANAVARTGYGALLMILAVALFIPILTVNQQQQQVSAAAQLYDSQLQTSAALFGQYCATCHGFQGQGLQGPQLNNNSVVNKLSDQDISRIISGGISANGDPTALAMPAWSQDFGGPLQPQDITGLVALIRSSDPAYRSTNGLENVNGFSYVFQSLTNPTQIAQYNEQKKTGSLPPLSQFTDETGKGTVTIPIMDTPTAANALYNFTPALVEVSAGTMITWMNQSSAPHTVVPKLTANSGNQLTFNGSASTILAVNGGSVTITFTQPGYYPYYCSIHPAMTGWIYVK
jgi:plastocyanin/mono/diheme cytochrome c family protein